MRWAIAAGLTCAGLTAQAWMAQEVVLTKAGDSKTLTVRYNGAKATLVELRINGVSVATRAVSGDATTGETNFTMDTTKLKDGDNVVQVRLYGADGAVLATEQTHVSMDRTASGPVFLSKPRSGDSVQGMVEISVGFKYEMKNSYVSFFVDDQFQSLKNYAPYNFLWDTNKITNGWHEVEAWVVDDASNTFRTQRMRIFVNNPGGRTERMTSPVNGNFEPRTSGSKPAETAKPVTTQKPVETKATAASPALTALVPSSNQFEPVVSKRSGTKAVTYEQGLATGQRVMRPTGNRDVAKPVNTEKTKASAVTPGVPSAGAQQTSKAVVDVRPSETVAVHSPATTSAATSGKPVSITFGTKLPDIGYFPILINGEPVEFDVMPRVTDGIALTPFRHLFEHVGGSVKWQAQDKVVTGNGLGQDVRFRIGDDFGLLNGDRVSFERPSFIENGRSIVPLSFVQRLLNVEVQYDPNTKHVLITKGSK
ncbi:MAG: hypothetical protein JSS66_16730 [Armatimonadetes bacterium]|nr:hypothetical protein [Armatimonadota bacterium]